MEKAYGFWEERTLRFLACMFGFQDHEWKVILRGDLQWDYPNEPFVLTHIFVHLFSRYIILIQNNGCGKLTLKIISHHLHNNVLIQRIRSESPNNLHRAKNTWSLHISLGGELHQLAQTKVQYICITIPHFHLHLQVL